jgi:hypothetical protein
MTCDNLTRRNYLDNCYYVRNFSAQINLGISRSKNIFTDQVYVIVFQLTETHSCEAFSTGVPGQCGNPGGQHSYQTATSLNKPVLCP